MVSTVLLFYYIIYIYIQLPHIYTYYILFQCSVASTSLWIYLWIPHTHAHTHTHTIQHTHTASFMYIVIIIRSSFMSVVCISSFSPTRLEEISILLLKRRRKLVIPRSTVFTCYCIFDRISIE